MILGEDLGHGLFVLVRQRAIREHPVVGLVAMVPGHGGPRPVVLVAGVIEDEIQRQRDAVVAQLGGQLRQLLHTAELSVHLAIAAHRITAVVVSVRAPEQWHQMQVGDAHLGEIRDTLAQPGQIAGEQIDVAHRANHPIGLEPGRVRTAHGVERLQLRRARDPHLGGGCQDALQMEEKIVVAAVQTKQILEKTMKMSLKALDVRDPLDLVHGATKALLQPRQQTVQRTLGLLPHPDGIRETGLVCLIDTRGIYRHNRLFLRLDHGAIAVAAFDQDQLAQSRMPHRAELECWVLLLGNDPALVFQVLNDLRLGVDDAHALCPPMIGDWNAIAGKRPANHGD